MTRFYIPSSGTTWPDAPVAAPPLVGWTGASGSNTTLIPTAPSNTGGATIATLGTTGQTRRTRMLVFYTATIADLGLADTLAGTVTMAATGENWLGNNERGLALQVRVVNNDLTAVKSALLPLADGVKSAAGGTYIRTLSAALVDQPVDPTDRLLIEVGAYHGPDGTGAGDFYMYPGNDSSLAEDMAFTQGGAPTGRQWIDFEWTTPPPAAPEGLPAYSGAEQLDRMYVGADLVEEIYLGSTKIY